MDEAGEVDDAAVVASSEASEMFEATEASLDLVAMLGGALLVEIKTGNTAADVYGGMGQLQLYPRLLPKLGEHVLVLLLPALPQPALLKAIRECGVSLHTYRLSNTAKGKVEFDADFLRLCGLA